MPSRRIELGCISGRITHDREGVAGGRVFVLGAAGFVLVTTAANGNYAVGVPAGKWGIFAWHPRYRNPLPRVVEVKAPGTTARVSFRVRPAGASVEGRVVDENGRPVKGAAVSAMIWGAAPELTPRWQQALEESLMPSLEGMQVELPFFVSLGPSPVTLSDGNGEFTLGLGPGEYHLYSSKPGYALSLKNLKLAFCQDSPHEAGRSAGKTPLGIPVKVRGGQRYGGTILIMTPESDAASSGPPAASPTGSTERITLFGMTSLTPNNVLYWLPPDREEHGPERYVVVRTRMRSAGKRRAGTREFPLAEVPHGVLWTGWHLFTDSTAVPGVTYHYSVYRRGPGGNSPPSNPVRITTR